VAARRVLFISSPARAFRYYTYIPFSLSLTPFPFPSPLLYADAVLYALKIETRDIFKGTERSAWWNKTSRCCCEKACFPLQYAIGVDYLFAAI
jgi:hypothetical protein